MLALDRRPTEPGDPSRPALETVGRFGGAVATRLGRRLRVTVGVGVPPSVAAGELLHGAGLRLGRLYGRGVRLLPRQEAVAARRAVAGRLLVVLAVGSLTFRLDSVVVAALLLDSGTLHALVPVAEVAAIGAALAAGVAWWSLGELWRPT